MYSWPVINIVYCSLKEQTVIATASFHKIEIGLRNLWLVYYLVKFNAITLPKVTEMILPWKILLLSRFFIKLFLFIYIRKCLSSSVHIYSGR